MARNSDYEYDLKFAACRDCGHQWDYESWSGFHRVLLCYNCAARRTDTLDARGTITNRHYKYPPGYHYKRTPKFILELRRQLRKEAQKLDRWIGNKTRRHLHIVKSQA